MNSVRFIPFLKVAFYLCIFVQFSDSQTTPFDEFAGVSVPDQTPEISNEAQKVYTTTVSLEKLRTETSFVESTFESAAAVFYADALGGFVSVTNAVGVEQGDNNIQVTYDVTYAYPVVLGAVNGDDSLITSTIGTFEPVKNGLNAQVNILSLYPVRDDASVFSFSGSAICSEATCNGTYVTCIEKREGIVATCVSECKIEYCENDGICSHSDRNVAPTCACTTLPDLWIIGGRCETKIALWLIVLLAVIGFLIILFVVLIVIFCVIRKRKRKKRKQDLLNSVPKTFENNGFVSDETRPPPTQIAPREPVRPATAVSTTLEREDSFETVTESEIPPSEYRPRSEADRRSYASSAHRHHHNHRHHEGHHHHHHSHDRRRHRSHSSERSRHRRSRSPERDRNQRRSRPQSASSTTTNESTHKQLRERNLSYYEIDVNEQDIETDAASSVAGTNSTKASPIKWLPPKNENQLRPGWVPSLGPMMYELPTSGAAAENRGDAPPYESVQYKRRREGGTDV